MAVDRLGLVYLPVGPNIVIPPRGYRAMFFDSQGVLNSMDENGARSPIAGGGGGGFAAALDIYVSPAGLNEIGGAFGSASAPYKTISFAYAQGLSAGAPFVLHVANDCVFCDGSEGSVISTYGLTVGQGLRVRGDGWAVPGWMPDVPWDLYGWGAGTTQSFADNAADLIMGKQDNSYTHRDDPAIWISGGGTHSHYFKRIAIQGNLPARIGWDYRRNENTTIARATITNATRTMVTGVDPWHRDPNRITTYGQTVYTVAFPTPWAVTALQRTSNITTATITAHPGGWNGEINSWIRITSTDGRFPSGDFQIISAVFSGPTSVTFTYADGGANTGLVNPSGSTASGHFCNPDDIVETDGSTDPNFPSLQYLVTAVTATTVTVADPFGNYHGRPGNVSSATAGTYVVEQRAQGIAFDNFEDCALFAIQNNYAVGLFTCGPALDHGANNSFGSTYTRGLIAGAGKDDADPTFRQFLRDPLTYAGILAWGGGAGGASITVRGTKFSVGNVYYQGNNVADGLIDCDSLIQDCPIGTSVRPVVELAGRGAGVVRIAMCVNADAQNGASDVDLGGFISNPLVTGCPVIIGQITSSVRTTVLAGSGGPIYGDWTLMAQSYEAQSLMGPYALDGRWAGRRIDLAGRFGLFQGLGLTNMLPTDLATWTQNVIGDTVTVTPGQPSPDGSSSAFKLHCAGSNGGSRYWHQTIPPAAAGDHFIFFVWARAPGTNRDNPFWMVLNNGGSLNNTLATCGTPFLNDGANDPVVVIGEVPAALAGITDLTIQMFVDPGKDYYVDGFFMLSLPAATYSKNEAYRLRDAVMHIPDYALPAGAVGSRKGQKVIAHGGIGTAKRYTVGGASGQIVIGAAAAQAIEVFDETGASLGVLRPNAFTVNP